MSFAENKPNAIPLLKTKLKFKNDVIGISKFPATDNSKIEYLLSLSITKIIAAMYNVTNFFFNILFTMRSFAW